MHPDGAVRPGHRKPTKGQARQHSALLFVSGLLASLEHELLLIDKAQQGWIERDELGLPLGHIAVCPFYRGPRREAGPTIGNQDGLVGRFTAAG